MVDQVPRLVSTKWLEDHLGSDELKVLDASWYLPSEKRDPESEFLLKHISGSKYFDINLFSDPDNELPHMVPSPDRFYLELSKLGVGDGNHVVFYDGLGMFSAARAWWLLKLFGFNRVSVLDGGLPKWSRENRPLSSKNSISNVSRIKLGFNNKLVCDWKQVKLSMANKPEQIIDARPAERFLGKAPEPRFGLRSGHIPGSTNICYKELLNSDHTFRDKEVLIKIFNSKGVDLNEPIITSCGSGVTAAILFLALEMVGAKEISLYDGSWAEWGSRSDLEVQSTR